MKETRISSNCVSLNQFEIDSRGTYNSELKLQTVQSISKNLKSKQTTHYFILRDTPPCNEFYLRR